MFKKIATGIICAATAFSICACGQTKTTTESNSLEIDSVLDETLEENDGEIITNVGFGDFEASDSLSMSIQNGELDGQIIVIDGISKTNGDSYSIGEESEQGAFIGTIYTIGDDLEYPGDGSHVTLKGVVKSDGPTHYIEAYEITLEE